MPLGILQPGIIFDNNLFLYKITIERNQTFARLTYIYFSTENNDISPGKLPEMYESCMYVLTSSQKINL